MSSYREEFHNSQTKKNKQVNKEIHGENNNVIIVKIYL